jgi:RNA polymerase sigma-70 factor (ECF subfamily)
MLKEHVQSKLPNAPEAQQRYAVGLLERIAKDNVLKMKEETDWAALLLAVKDNQDRDAFAQLFRHFAPRVKAFLMKSGTDAGLAEECAQDVMAVLWQKAHQFDPARASVATWVFTIARNRRIDVARKARRPEPEDIMWGPDGEPDQADVYEAAQETRKLTKALSELPEKQRALIKRAYYGELSHSEIAAETGLPLGTIKSRIRLALDSMRLKLS